MSRRNGKARYREPAETRRMTVEAMLAQYEPESKKARPVVYVSDVREIMKTRTEREYADILDARKAAGEVECWRYEAHSVRLGHDCHLTPDFLVVLSDGRIEYHEVKGGMIEEKAMTKMKTCVTLYPFIPLILCQKKGKDWTFTRIKHGGPILG